MIKYELKCGECSGQFEGWFADSSTYDRQAKAGDLSCPYCASHNISKAIMAPNIARRRGADEGTFMSGGDTRTAVREALREVRREVEANSENVGKNFPNEARKIHYGEAEERSIYGEASREEAVDLVEEGVDVTPIPWIRDADA